MHRVRDFFERNAWWITLLPVLLSCTFIFYFSAQPAVSSAQTSDRVVEFVIRVLFPDFNEFSLDKQESLRETITFIVRKTAHFREFASLGFFLALHLEALRRTRGLKLDQLPRMAVSWMAGTVYAVGDEIHQTFVPGRSGELRDVLVDSSGVLFGAGLFTLLLIFFMFLKTSKNNV